MEQKIRKEVLLKEYLTTSTSVRKLAGKYGMSVSTMQRQLMTAKKQKSKKGLSEAEKLPKRPNELPEDVQQLQETLYEAQLRISLLEAIIDISDEQFGTDIKKKLGTRQ